MRIGAEWIYSKEEEVNPQLEDAAWVGIGYIIADAGALLLLVSLITGGIGVRKLRTRWWRRPPQGEHGDLAPAARRGRGRRLGHERQAVIGAARRRAVRREQVRAMTGGARWTAGGRLRRPEANRVLHSVRKEGARAEPGPHNDHGPHNRGPAIGRQTQRSPLALRLTLHGRSCDIRRTLSSRAGHCPVATGL